MQFSSIRFFYPLISCFLAFHGCKSPQGQATEAPSATPSGMQIARLAQGDEAALASIRSTFAARNPGYELAYDAGLTAIAEEAYPRVLFVQEGNTQVHLSSGTSSQVTVGDIVLLNAGTSLAADSLLSLLIFRVPDAPHDSIPEFIRPDWDPHITDIPGGCATETNAYRRILLTWKNSVGYYLYHSLNAHRVRIMDSFSHYHPVEGGFDEFYLVQMVLPGAKILTSSQTEAIIQPESLTAEHAATLMQSTELQVGDLVYLPRGTVHRGVGGVLTQVITVPGFIPGSEIGVDHHLRKINESLGLAGEASLPFNESASLEAIVK